jgi:hypothetical protein
MKSCAYIVIVSIAIAGRAWAQDNSLEVILAVRLKPACDRLIPNFAKQNQTNYEAWRHQHASKIDELERSATGPSQQPMAPASEQERQQVERECGMLVTIFDTAAPADPRLSSPASTWELFLKSLKTGDRASVLLCLAGTAKYKTPGLWAKMSDEQLRDLADSFGKIRFDEEQASTVHSVVQMRSGYAGAVIFEKLGNNWRIVDL